MGLAPVGAAYLLLSHRHRPLLRRFSPSLPGGAGTGCSGCMRAAGEVFVARALLNALRERTATTDCSPSVPFQDSTLRARYCLMSQPRCALRFGRECSPLHTTIAARALIILETELWPNLIRETRERGAVLFSTGGSVPGNIRDTGATAISCRPSILISHVGFRMRCISIDSQCLASRKTESP